jgi:hypothetical protein
MPERRKTKEVRAEIERLLGEYGGMTAAQYAQYAGINPQNASSTLRRLVEGTDMLVESTRVVPNARGRRQRVPYYTLNEKRKGQMKLAIGEPAKKRSSVTPWEELTPGQQAARVSSREYYRRQQAKKGRIVKPRLGDDEGYRYGRGKVRGRPKSERSLLLESSDRLGQAARILFPNGAEMNEEFFAWVDLTRELMNG